MSSDSTAILRQKERLEAAAGEDFPIYLIKLKQYFTEKISKDDFDAEIGKFLSSEAIHYHNQLIRLIADDSFASVPTCTPSDFYLENVLGDAAASNDKAPKKRLKLSHYNPTGTSPFRPVSVSSYLPVTIPPRHESEIPTCINELCLPDKGALQGLMLALAWGEGIDVVDQQAIELIAYAVRFQIKNILMAILSRRNSFKVREGKFKFAMGSPAVNVYLQNTQKLKSSQNFSEETEVNNVSTNELPIASVAEAESMAATEFACSGEICEEKTPVSPWDLYETLKIYRGIIPSHEVYSKALEEISAALYHPSSNELEQALLRKYQERFNSVPPPVVNET